MSMNVAEVMMGSAYRFCKYVHECCWSYLFTLVRNNSMNVKQRNARCFLQNVTVISYHAKTVRHVVANPQRHA